MALIDELKEKLKDVETYIAARHAQIREHGSAVEELERQRWDLDLAIAALTPAPTTDLQGDTVEEMKEAFDAVFEAQKAQAVEIEIPEGWVAWAGGVYGDFVRDNPSIDRVSTELEVILRNGTRCKGLPGGFLWNHEGVWNDIIAYRIIEAAPADEQDDASEFAEPAPDPEFVVLDEQTCEPVEERPALNADMQDEREQPVEGYAPVTNPEADALARAHDYYSPEKIAERNKFNPFAMFRREPEEVS